LPLDFSKCLIFQCFLFLLQKWDKFLPLQNQRLMNLTPCDRLRRVYCRSIGTDQKLHAVRDTNGK
jgi:hypothetical protein